MDGSLTSCCSPIQVVFSNKHKAISACHGSSVPAMLRVCSTKTWACQQLYRVIAFARNVSDKVLFGRPASSPITPSLSRAWWVSTMEIRQWSACFWHGCFFSSLNLQLVPGGTRRRSRAWAAGMTRGAVVVVLWEGHGGQGVTCSMHMYCT